MICYHFLSALHLARLLPCCRQRPILKDRETDTTVPHLDITVIIITSTSKRN